MAYEMVATAMTLNDLEGHSPVADVFKCNPSHICAAFYTITRITFTSDHLAGYGLVPFSELRD